MNNSCAALLIALLAISNSSSAASLDQKLDEFRQFSTGFRREKNIPSFSVAVVKDNEVVLAEGIGWQDHDAEEQTTVETTYLVASISKTFSAAALLAMEADASISSLLKNIVAKRRICSAFVISANVRQRRFD